MKLLSLFFALLAVLITTVSAWEKEDHEIFDLVTELEAAEGKGTTFYSWLEVPFTASTNEIAKAYRKKSMQLHPDKNPNVKGVHERFARLGVISTILRNKEAAMRRKVIALGPRLPWNKEELLLEVAGKLYVLASSLNQNRCGLYNGGRPLFPPKSALVTVD